MFGDGDNVRDLDSMWSPNCTLVKGFVEYHFGTRWSHWTAVEIISTVEAGVG